MQKKKETGKGPLHIHMGTEGKINARVRNEKANPVSNVFGCLFRNSVCRVGR